MWATAAGHEGYGAVPRPTGLEEEFSVLFYLCDEEILLVTGCAINIRIESVAENDLG